MTDKIFASPVSGYHVKAITETDSEIIIPVVGIPFGSPTDKDLHNEYFDKSTDVGVLNEVMVYFNHNQFYPANDSPDELEKAALLARAFKGEILGIAKKAETTEEGVIYNIVLDKRKRYAKALRQMVEDNLLDVSSGSKYRELDPNNEGRISKWHTVEISLTPSPANPNAVPLTKSILEKALEETKMPNEVNETPQELDGEKQAQPQPDPTEDLMNSLKSVLETPAPVEEKSQPSEAEMRIAQLQAQVETLTELVKSIQTALPYIAQQIVERIDGSKSASTFERQAQTQNANSAMPPKPAPTPVHGKNIFGNVQNGPKIPMLKAIGDGS